tara:strand:- start:269 stop:439 length:171 start_codon:yes stop_codon:yes gene_type:complete
VPLTHASVLPRGAGADTSLHYFRHFSLFLQELDVAIDWQLFIAVGEQVVIPQQPQP